MRESKRTTAAQRRARQSVVMVRLPGGVEVVGQGDGREQALRDVLHQAEALDEAVHQAARDRRNEPDCWPTGPPVEPAYTGWTLTARGWAAVYRQRRGVA
jgi:hypothetical protein